MTPEDRGSLATRIEAEKDQWKELATGRHINYEDGLCEGLDVAAGIVRNHTAAPGPAGLVPALACRVASTVVRLRKAVADLAKSTPAAHAVVGPFLAPYLGPLPFETELMSGKMDQVEHALTAMTRDPAASPWIPVAQRLPEDDQHVLILLRIPRTSPAWGSGHFCSPDQTWMSDEGEVPLSRVSHWMPIPDLPPPTGA